MPLDALRKYRLEAGLGERKALVFAGPGLPAAVAAEVRALALAIVPAPDDPAWQVGGRGKAAASGRLPPPPARALHQPPSTRRRHCGLQVKAHQHFDFGKLKCSGANEEGLRLLKRVREFFEAAGWLEEWRVPSMELVARLNNDNPDHYDNKSGSLAYQRVR